MSNIDFDKRLFNPNFHHVIKYLNDNTLRYLFFYGGSSSSKTFSIVQAIVLLTLQDGKNTLIFRKVSTTIKKSIYNDFKTIINALHLNDYFTLQDFKIKCFNGAIIDFTGLDDSEKIKGLSSYYRLMYDEITESDFSDFKQLRKRMRGIEGQKLIATFNPIDECHWIKQEIYDKLKLESLPTRINNNILTEVAEVQRCNNYIFVKSTYLNNYYIVGSPDGEWGYVDNHTIEDFENDKQLDYDFYRIYALAEWGKITSGSEFYKQFNRTKHVSNFELDYNLPLHISIDENVNPYLPLTITQIESGYITVVDEILGKNPYNNITDVIRTFSNKYEKFKNNKIFVYGDATSRKRDARTEKGYNLFGMIYSELQENGFKDVTVRVPQSNPSVSQSGRFMNMLLAGMIKGYNLNIDESCLETIKDFLYTKEDKDGGILKERVKDKINGTTYEKHGHCFIGKTLITTINGEIEIKNIKVGDLVLTRNGYKKVINVYNNGYKKTNKYKIGNVFLECTPEHRIWTKSKNFYEIDKIGCDTFYIYDKKNKSICQKKLSFTKESNFTSQKNLNIIQDTSTVLKKDYTYINMNKRLERYQKDIIYITRILTKIIMKLKIYNHYQQKNTKDYMVKKNIQNYLKKLNKNKKKYLLKNQEYFINQKKVKNGTKIISENVHKQYQGNVMNVAKNLLKKDYFQDLKYHSVHSNVQIKINQEEEEKAELIMKKEFVASAEKNLQQINILKNLNVQNVNEVYDIEVEDEHEYFANGILVHNCSDTIRYLCCEYLQNDFYKMQNKNTGSEFFTINISDDILPF